MTTEPARELVSLVDELIDRLPLHCAFVVRRHLFHGLSYAEITSDTGLSVATIKAYANRGMALLRDSLKEEWSQDDLRELLGENNKV